MKNGEVKPGTEIMEVLLWEAGLCPISASLNFSQFGLPTVLEARLWTSLRNPKDCKRGQATKRGPIWCAMIRVKKNIFHIGLRRSEAAWTLPGNSLGLNGLVT